MKSNYCDQLDIRAVHLLGVTSQVAARVQQVYLAASSQPEFNTGMRKIKEYAESHINDEGELDGIPDNVVEADFAVQEIGRSSDRYIWRSVALYAYLSHIHSDDLSSKEYHALTAPWRTVVEYAA